MGRRQRDPRPVHEPPGRASSGEWIAAAVLVAVALALRLVFLAQVSDHVLFSSLTGDPAAYHARAMEILAGNAVPPHAYFHSSPLYPFFLAIVARFAGPGYHAARVVQAVIGSASVLLVWQLGRVTVGRRAGLVAGLLAALYVPFIFFVAETLEITIVIAFATAMLIALLGAAETGSVGRAAAAGVLLGLASLGKPNLLLFAPVGSVWLYLQDPRGRGLRPPRATRRGRGAAGRHGRRRVLPAAAFFVACGLTILPATVHNYRAEGDLIPVSSNGGINLWIGNNPRSPGIFNVPPEMRFDLRVASKAVAERAVGREMTSGEVSRFWTREALRFVRERPGAALALTGRKLALFWNHYEIPNHYHSYYVALAAPVLRIPVGTFAVVAPLGLMGIALALARGRRVGLLVAFGITFMLSVLPFFVTGRYRLAIAPVLLVGAGYAVTALVETVRRRDRRALALGAGGLALLAVAVNVRIFEMGFAHMHNTVGALLGEGGDTEGAATEFRRAIKDNPRDLSARYNLGTALLELGQWEEAAVQFMVATEGHPRYHEAWIGLGKARAGQGRTADARELWERALALDPPPAVAAEVDSLIGTLEDARPAGGDR